MTEVPRWTGERERGPVAVGMAARRIDRQPAEVAPRLRVVSNHKSRPVARTRAVRSSVQRALVVAVTVLMLAGGARVTIAAQATEAGYRAWELKSQVEAERKTARSLAVDVGALSTPSRIEALASETLNMSRPASVSHIVLPSGGESVAAVADTAGQPAAADQPDVTAPSGEPMLASAGTALVATLLDLAAREAQVLLVGDMGLGAGR